MLPPVILIIALVFAVIAAIVGVCRGFKRYYPSLAVIVGSGVVAFAATLILKKTAGPALSELVRTLMADLFESDVMATVMETMPTAAGFVDALPAALAAPFVFAVLYCVVLTIAEITRAITTAIIRSSRKKAAAEAAQQPAAPAAAQTPAAIESASAESAAGAAPAEQTAAPAPAAPAPAAPAPAAPTKKSKAPDRLLGLAAGAVGGAVMAFCMLLPLIGYLGMMSGAISKLEQTSPETLEAVFEDEETEQLYIDFVKPMLSDPYVKLSGTLGGKAVFNGLSGVKVEGKNYPFADLVATALNIFGHVTPFMGEDIANYGQDQTDAIEHIVADLEGDALLTNVGAEFVAALASAWSRGDAFMDIEPVAVDGAFAPVMDELTTVLSTTTNKTVIGDLRVVAELASTMIKYDAMALLGEDGGDFKKLLAKPGFVSELCEAVQSNERMAPVFAAISRLGVSMISEMVGIPDDSAAGGVNIKAIVDSIKTSAPSDPAAEAKKIEAAVTAAITVIESLDSQQDNPLFAVDSKAVEDIIVNLSETETFGDAVPLLLEGICSSEVLEGTGFSGAALYESIEKGGYDNIANTIDTVGQTAKMLDKLSGGSPAADTDVREELEWLITNMTPETAGLITDQINADTLSNYGLSGQSAESVSGLVSNMLTAMTDQSTMTPEEYKTESDAIGHLFEVATGLSDAASGESVFEDKVAAAADIAHTVLDSKVVSSALMGAAYDQNGQLKSDPLALGIQLSEGDKASLVAALNSRSAADESAKQKITALAAVFNVDINIASDGTVTLAK